MISPSLLARIGRRDFGVAAGAFLVVALLLGFGLLADKVVEGGTARFDLAVLTALRTGNDLANPIGPAWVQETGRDVTALGSFVYLGFLSTATVGYLLLVGKRGLAMLVVASVLGGALASTLLKYGIDRPRPDFPNAVRVFTPGFPSGHATLATVTFLTLGVLPTRGSADRRVKSYFMGLSVFLTVAVGLSRILPGRALSERRSRRLVRGHGLGGTLLDPRPMASVPGRDRAGRRRGRSQPVLNGPGVGAQPMMRRDAMVVSGPNS